MSIRTIIILCLLVNTYYSLMLISPSAERNKQVIGSVLTRLLPTSKTVKTRTSHVVEIASGTGEHASYFNSLLPDMLYLPSDPNVEMHESIKEWTKDYRDRVLPPIDFNILNHEDFVLPQAMNVEKVDLVICINMIHISHFDCTRSLFKLANKILNDNGLVYTYGAYKVNGSMSESNIAFDESLRSRNADWGIRNIEDVMTAAADSGFMLSETIEMPSNNLSLIFCRLH
jgi:hypothetical protein